MLRRLLLPALMAFAVSCSPASPPPSPASTAPAPPPASSGAKPAPARRTGPITSIHQEELASTPETAHLTEAQASARRQIRNVATSTGKQRHDKYKVFGWHAHGLGDAYKSYDFSLLWGIAYCGYEVDPATGDPKSIFNWKTTGMVDMAKKAGTKVFLTVFNFGDAANKTLLSNPKATANLIDNLVTQLAARNGDGISVDFEGVPGELRDQFTQFLIDLAAKLKARNPKAMIALATYTVDWDKIFEVPKLKGAVDLYTLMAYDYYYPGSPTAGPVAPLRDGTTWEPISVEKSVDYYLGLGVEPQQLLLGLPYYGRQWKTEALTFPSKNLGYISSPAFKTYADMADESKDTYDPVSATFVHPYTENGQNRQLWYGGVRGLGAKYDFAIQKGLGGVGIWALGYDNGRRELWDLLAQKFGK